MASSQEHNWVKGYYVAVGDTARAEQHGQRPKNLVPIGISCADKVSGHHLGHAEALAADSRADGRSFVWGARSDCMICLGVSLHQEGRQQVMHEDLIDPANLPLSVSGQRWRTLNADPSYAYEWGIKPGKGNPLRYDAFYFRAKPSDNDASDNQSPPEYPPQAPLNISADVNEWLNDRMGDDGSPMLSPMAACNDPIDLQAYIEDGPLQAMGKLLDGTGSLSHPEEDQARDQAAAMPPAPTTSILLNSSQGLDMSGLSGGSPFLAAPYSLINANLMKPNLSFILTNTEQEVDIGTSIETDTLREPLNLAAAEGAGAGASVDDASWCLFTGFEKTGANDAGSLASTHSITQDDFYSKRRRVYFSKTIGPFPNPGKVTLRVGPASGPVSNAVEIRIVKMDD